MPMEEPGEAVPVALDAAIGGSFRAVLQEDRRAMPRQHTHHGRIVYVFPDDFPQRLVRFKEESGLSWAELARRLGTSALNLRRWKDKGVRPHWRHLTALLELAGDLGLVHIFTDWTVPDGTPFPGQRGGRDRRG